MDTRRQGEDQANYPNAIYAMPVKEFARLLTNLSKQGASVQEGFHKLLMAGMTFSASASQGGDNNGTPIMQIMQGLPSMISKVTVKNWIECHTNVRVALKIKDGVELWAVKMVSPNGEGFKPELNFDRANAKPFYAKQAEKDHLALAFDDKALAKALAAISAKIMAAKEKGLIDLSPIALERANTIINLARTANEAVRA